jgi:hypothetical protein
MWRVVKEWKLCGVKLPVSEADNPLKKTSTLMMLYLYSVITHLYPESLSINTKKFCRFINLEMKMIEGLFYVFFFHIYQSHPSGRRIYHRGLRLIDLTVVKYIRQIDDRMVA